MLRAQWGWCRSRGWRRFFRVPERESGVRAATRSLFRREWRDVRAVDGISFEIGPGEVVGFLGPNGGFRVSSSATHRATRLLLGEQACRKHHRTGTRVSPFVVKIDSGNESESDPRRLGSLPAALRVSEAFDPKWGRSAWLTERRPDNSTVVYLRDGRASC
jgi:hypothetical protein